MTTSYIGSSSVGDSSRVPQLLPLHYNIITLTNILVRELLILIIVYNNTDIGNKNQINVLTLLTFYRFFQTFSLFFQTPYFETIDFVFQPKKRQAELLQQCGGQSGQS